jgi:Putative Ig domain
MAAFQGSATLSAVRYASDGSTISRSVVPLPYYLTAVAIDPFGALHVLARSFGSGQRTGFWTMKYDGLSGRELWPAPRRFEGPEDYAAPSSIAVARDGDVAVTGSVSVDGFLRFATIRYERRTGAVRWGPVFVGEDGRSGNPYALALDSAGDVIVAGTDVPATYDPQPGWTAVKHDGKTGAVLWKTVPVGVFGYPRVCPGFCFTSYAAKLGIDSRRDVFLAVTSFDGTSQEWLTVKYAGATGATLWGPVDLNGPERDYATIHDLAVDANGDVIGTGFAEFPSQPWSESDRLVVKYEGATGRLLWGPMRLSPFGLARGTGFALDGFGNPILSGAVVQGVTHDWSVAKFSGRDGAPLWRTLVLSDSGEPGANSSPRLLSLGGDGAVVLLGMHEYIRSEARIVTLASSTGSLRWGPATFVASARTGTNPVATVADSKSHLILISNEFDREHNRGFTRKVDGATGQILWGPRALSDRPRSQTVAAAVDARDDVVVTGWAAENAADWTTVKYAGMTGDVLWEASVLAAPDSIDVPSGLALDRRGDVFVLGNMESTGLRTWALVKYQGAIGNLSWGPVIFPAPPIEGGSLRDSFARLVAVDETGDVFVAAWMRTQVDRYDWATSKYDGSTGALLWGPVVLESFHPGGWPMDLAVDPHGDVIVTGLAEGRNSKWATIKYSGRTGEILWGPVRNPGDYGQPRQMAVDPDGDVVVVGQEFRGDETRWSLLKYAGASGAVAWGPVIAPGSFSEDGPALSLDPDGNPILLVSFWNGSDSDWIVVKYGRSTGQPIGSPITYDGGQHERPVALSASGRDFFVTGIQGTSALTVRYTEGLGVETFAHDVDPAYCGNEYRLSLVARNGTPPYSWALAGGSLPGGLSLSVSGEIVGEPREEGTFPLTVRVTDSFGAKLERDFTLEVSEGGDRPSIVVEPGPLCPTGYHLSLSGSYTAYSWLPDGQSTPAIDVCPEHPSVFGVVAADERGCAHRASVELAPAPIPARQPVVRMPRPRPPTVPRSR